LVCALGIRAAVEREARSSDVAALRRHQQQLLLAFGGEEDHGAAARERRRNHGTAGGKSAAKLRSWAHAAACAQQLRVRSRERKGGS
jgi:hypothetical protein